MAICVKQSASITIAQQNNMDKTGHFAFRGIHIFIKAVATPYPSLYIPYMKPAKTIYSGIYNQGMYKYNIRYYGYNFKKKQRED